MGWGLGIGNNLLLSWGWIGFIGCIGFIGIGGIHDFYLGNYGKGIIKLFTINWFMLGTILDLIRIASGGYKDNSGAPLRQ